MRTNDGELFCDVCRERFPADATVRFTHRDDTYELELCGPHLRKLDRVLEEFVQGARAVSEELVRRTDSR